MVPVANYVFTMLYKPLILCKLSQDPNNGQGSDTSSQYGDHFCQKVVKSDFISLIQITKLWVGHVFAARLCCDIDLQCSDPNLAGDTSSQYGDHYCEIVFHEMLRVHIVHIATYSHIKLHAPSFNDLSKDPDF